MKNSTPETSFVLPPWMRPWEQFWFTPADPALLALIRISCGLIVVYTLVAYSFKLQEFMGEHAWHDMQLRMDIVRNRPVSAGWLRGAEHLPLPEPANDAQRMYRDNYRKLWSYVPPPPYPANEEEAQYLNAFRYKFGFDLRSTGLSIPKNAKEKEYAERYAERWRVPPPAYPKDEAEEKAIDEYMEREPGQDPRRLYAKGMPVFSIWFHVLDPQAMNIIHSLFIMASVLFTLGFCTRLTSAITWFASLCYIHRNPTILFGADTMMTILLLYLMISPCGAVLSVDRWLRRWWSQAKPGVVQGWYRFWKRPVPSAADIAPVVFSEIPLSSVSANVAIRLLQIHVCMVYLMSGLSKLLGNAWWNGTAVWSTVANAEFAPLQFDLYLQFLRFLGSHQLLLEGFLTFSGLFTLTFEIGYAFLIWRPKLRWVFLTMAIMLHAGIGLFMGLKTFSMLMLVMNMAFLRKEEVYWLLGRLGVQPGVTAATAQRSAEPPRAPAVVVAAGAIKK